MKRLIKYCRSGKKKTDDSATSCQVLFGAVSNEVINRADLAKDFKLITQVPHNLYSCPLTSIFVTVVYCQLLFFNGQFA